ncbi:MAG: MarR family transcriptional regulator [Kiritimatiellia bacterium]|nr:MarR family transcriptional regulator [Kiritimatiellia bacterium]
MNNSKDKTTPASGTINRMSVEQFADRLGVLMHKMAGMVLSAERNYLARGVITLPQLWVLHEIADAGNCPMLSISRNLGIKSSTVTGIMDRLVKLGLVKRCSSESDRRSVLAEATPKGRRILEHIHAERRHTLINAFGPLSAKERADYLAIIGKVADQIGARKQKNAEDG